MQALEKAGLLDRIVRQNVFKARPVLEASLYEAPDAAGTLPRQKQETTV
jgi:hypothetical protein